MFYIQMSRHEVLGIPGPLVYYEQWGSLEDNRLLSSALEAMLRKELVKAGLPAAKFYLEPYTPDQAATIPASCTLIHNLQDLTEEVIKMCREAKSGS